MTTRGDHAAGRLAWASRARLDGQINEDRVGMTENAVWILDGAGTAPGVKSCCDADASWYVDKLSSALAAVLRDNPPRTLAEGLATAIANVQSEHATICSNPEAGRGPSSTVAIVRRRAHRLDVLVLGDSPVLVDFGGQAALLTDTRLQRVARPLREQIKGSLASGFGYNAIRHQERRRQLIAAERAARNRDGGYWIAADDPRAAQQAVTATYQIGAEPSSVRRVLLMSDGVHRASSVLGLYPSESALLTAVASCGPDTCIRRIRDTEARDLHGRNHPRTKLSDDATVVLWDLLPTP